MNENCVESDKHRVEYLPEQGTVVFAGSLRLNAAAEYAPISALLDRSLDDRRGAVVVWDLAALEFLNSSGINMLYQAVIKARKQGDVAVNVIGADAVIWQKKSLANMQRFMPGLILEMR